MRHQSTSSPVGLEYDGMLSLTYVYPTKVTDNRLKTLIPSLKGWSLGEHQELAQCTQTPLG